MIEHPHPLTRPGHEWSELRRQILQDGLLSRPCQESSSRIFGKSGITGSIKINRNHSASCLSCPVNLNCPTLAAKRALVIPEGRNLGPPPSQRGHELLNGMASTHNPLPWGRSRIWSRF